ncbi:hypothetical protein BC827DRAFT_1265439 [Russula dissimulans]|nr:hypothetical protein BC827DRAFT_1265439 [Russula dissimulans]
MPDDSISFDDEDWEVITDDWWHTPLSLAPCPLSWIDRQSRQRRRSEVAANNSHYWHESLLLIAKNVQGAGVCESCRQWHYMRSGGAFVCDAMKGVGVQGDLELNVDLVGVKMVLAMVGQLEHAVGIATTDHRVGTAGEIAILARRVSLLLSDAPPLAPTEGSWREHTATFLDGYGIAPHGAAVFRPDLDADPPPTDGITSILDLDLDPPRRKSPRFSREVIDLTDSEQSVASEAPPATPKPSQSFPSGSDGTMSGDLPKFHLPRVPSSPSISYSSTSPLTSDGLCSEFSHTRSSSLPPGGDLHKEDYDVDVVSESSPSEEAEIPLFLVTSSDRPVRRHSRTREIIDRLRSATVPRGRARTSTARGGNGDASMPAKNPRAGLDNATVKQLFQKGNDGWIRLADDAEPATTKAQDPLQSGHADDESRNPAENQSAPSETEEAPPAPKSTRESRKRQAQSKHVRRTSRWVDGPSPAAVGPPRGAHAPRPALSVVQPQPAAPASVGTFTFPPPAYYAYPSLPILPYPPMVSFGPPPYRGCPPRAGYPHASPPFAGSLLHQHQHQHPHQNPYPHPYMYQPHRAPHTNPPVITGATGIRHAPW